MMLLNPLDDQDSLVATSAPPGVTMLPWESPHLSADVRMRMRTLSQERLVFLTPPKRLAAADPPFFFDLRARLTLVLEALSADRSLERQRNLLVPREVSEEQFFFNYFAHLHVLAIGMVDAQLAAVDVAGSASERTGSSSPLLVSRDEALESDDARVPRQPGFDAGQLEEEFEGISVAAPPIVLAAGSGECSSGSVSVVVADSVVDWEAELEAELAR